jgi:hypothetical protein
MLDSNKPILASDKKKLTDRGKGFGMEYKPFIYVGEISSQGESYRIRSAKVGRVHHLLSSIELAAFLVFDCYQKTTDIREQFPIQIEDSLEICRQLGIKHPQVSGKLTVVTTDLLINFQDKPPLALAVKPHTKLSDGRVIEKLQIEKAFFEQKGYEWKIFTELEITPPLHENLSWLQPLLSYKENRDDSISIDIDEIYKVVERVLRIKNRQVNLVCADFDGKYQVEEGYHFKQFCLAVAYNIVSAPIYKSYYVWTTDQIKVNASTINAWRHHVS